MVWLVGVFVVCFLGVFLFVFLKDWVARAHRRFSHERVFC